MKIASQKVLNTFMGITIVRAVNDLVFVNILLYFAFDGFIFDILIFITLTISNFTEFGMLAGVISYGNLVCDLEIASTHLTFIFSMWNLANMIPKFYTHFFVMKFGIFLPNAIGCVATIIITIIAYQFYQNPKMYSRIKTSKEHLKTD